MRTGPGHILELTFDDGSGGSFDVGPFLWGPAFNRLRTDPALFAAVRVDEEAGTIVWPNGADLAPEFLYDHAVLPPVFDHDPRTHPSQCLFDALTALAGTELQGRQRQQTLEHGRAALAELDGQVTSARAWARALFHDPAARLGRTWEDAPTWLTRDPELHNPWAHRTLRVLRPVVAPGETVTAFRPDRAEGAVAAFDVGDRVWLSGPGGARAVAGVVKDAGGFVVAKALTGTDVDVELSFSWTDSSGRMRVLVDELTHPQAAKPGALLLGGASPRERVWVQVVDRTGQGADEVVQLRALPVLVVDESLLPDPRGVPAWSTDEDNEALPHPLAAGDLVAERDAGDPPGTEMPARITWVEPEPDRPGAWRYRVLPAH
ncbi:DUF2442 domain-containing protein [Phycicoccus sp. M110.8]|uniref:DUF2442 domain-containing protein n=1 Tax=Phycicoccus sp. M110.8 TaxID=3075433 RepID=UPI0028FDA7BF|nr:DUF2442 domain-containing protein [Phycicoccus sp. M110.8]MDU0314086.1 DUF2442 domain-containing protein [Phycicoccus sp. M110.8]